MLCVSPAVAHQMPRLFWIPYALRPYAVLVRRMSTATYRYGVLVQYIPVYTITLTSLSATWTEKMENRTRILVYSSTKLLDTFLPVYGKVTVPVRTVPVPVRTGTGTEWYYSASRLALHRVALPYGRKWRIVPESYHTTLPRFYIYFFSWESYH